MFGVTIPEVEKALECASIYNATLYPFSVILPIIFALGAVALLINAFKRNDSFSSGLLKAWIALIYGTFGGILMYSLYPLDPMFGLSGALSLWFISLVFLLDAFWWKRMIFRFPAARELRILSIFFMVHGALLYPLIELITGMRWPAMVLLGAECPTGTFVIGILMTSLEGRTNRFLFALLATTATIMGGYGGYLGIDVDFFTYFPAGIVGWAMLARYWDRGRDGVIKGYRPTA